jgi:hypothetical protein
MNDRDDFGEIYRDIKQNKRLKESRLKVLLVELSIGRGFLIRAKKKLKSGTDEKKATRVRVPRFRLRKSGHELQSVDNRPFKRHQRAHKVSAVPFVVQHAHVRQAQVVAVVEEQGVVE